MATNIRLPRLLGKEPDIRLNENEITNKIQENFSDGLDKSNFILNDSK